MYTENNMEQIEKDEGQPNFPKGIIFLLVISLVYILYKLFLSSVDGWVEILILICFFLFVVLSFTKLRIVHVAAPILFCVIFLVQFPNALIIKHEFTRGVMSAHVEFDILESLFGPSPEEALKKSFPSIKLEGMDKKSSFTFNFLLFLYLPIIAYLALSNKVRLWYVKALSKGGSW